jgi:CheY-like chemotaxis protein
MMKKALIIEDDQHMIANLTELLSLEGFEVQSICNGSEALDSARDFQPDIILSDMRMPGMEVWCWRRFAVTRDFRHRSFFTAKLQLHDALIAGEWLYLAVSGAELLEVINHFVPITRSGSRSPAYNGG